MNWYIFAIVVLTGVSIVACISAHAWGKQTGHAQGYLSGANDARDSFTEHERIAYNNGEIAGFQRGREFQQRVQANRARDAARRDGKGRFKKGGG
jgi:hypothetical protein